MEFGLVENFTNTTFEFDNDEISFPMYIFYGVILSIVCVIGVCVDLTTVYMIFRFKKLQTVPNIIIANWAAADVYPLLVTPVDYVLYPFIEYESLIFEIIGYFYELAFVFYNTILFFVACLIVDWVLVSYCTKASERYRKYYKFIVAAIWILTLIIACTSLTLITYDLFFIPPITSFFFTYITLLILVIILQCVRQIKKCKAKSSNYPALTLHLATVALLLWLERWLGLGIADVVDKYFPYLKLIGYPTFTVIFVILYCSNPDFQACFRQLCKRPNNRYVDEISDFQASIKSTNGDNQTMQNGTEAC